MDGELEDYSFDDDEEVNSQDFKINDFWFTPTYKTQQCKKCKRNRTIFLMFHVNVWYDLTAYDCSNDTWICIYCGLQEYNVTLSYSDLLCSCYRIYILCRSTAHVAHHNLSQNILKIFHEHDPLWKQHYRNVICFLLCWRVGFHHIPRDVVLIIAKKIYYDF